MRELPILFSTPMVRALLDGRKSQTRRIVKPQPSEHGVSFMPHAPALDWEQHYGQIWEPWYWETEEGESISKPFSPYGQAGDLLYVRETWTRGWLWDGDGEHPRDRTPREPMQYLFRASDDFDSIDENGDDLKWKPSIHMPKAASRIWLQVESVGVERLQEINENEAIAEGVQENTCKNPASCPSSLKHERGGCCGKGEWWNYLDKSQQGEPCYSPIHSFETLWESINGPGSWEANPFVWVVKFTVLSTTGRPETINK